MASEAELKMVSSQTMKELKELERATNWVLVDDEPCSVYTMERGERLANKLQLVLKLPLQTVLEFLFDPANMSRISEQKLQTKVLLEKENLRVLHTKVEGFWPISDRDMVFVNTLESEGGKTYLGNKSCQFPVKEDPDSVRMEIIVSGSILEKLDEQRCKLTSISDVDLKGSIPNFVKNSLATKRAASFSKLEKAIREGRK